MKLLMFASLFALLGAHAVELPSSCLNLEDGLHYLKPLSDEDFSSLKTGSDASPIVEARCADGFTIIDPNFDSSWESLFTSFHSYHSSYSGPDLNDHVTWTEWFLPSVEDSGMTWSVSTDCYSCGNDDEATFGVESVYYMTGDSFGCTWVTKKECDFDPETLECYKCVAGAVTGGIEETGALWGKCGHMPMSANSRVESDHAMCTEDSEDEGSSIPSIGMTSKYCVCYQPSQSQKKVHLADDKIYRDYIKVREAANNEVEEEQNVMHQVHLSQKDFEKGTYRITQSGIYIIDEDIEFDFNAGDMENPNAAGSWYPSADQADEYPGAGEDDGWYWLGFFAGMTVEVDDVTIDLNGHELKMSPAFFLQQRWFTVIELASKSFTDGQGPTFTGTGIKFTQNVVVKNGVIGLSSHIGIHGNNCTNVVIENVHVKDFETHGIGINEFSGLTLRDVEVGPSVNGQLGLNGNYAMARILLPLIRSAVEELELGLKADTISFKGRSNEVYTFRQLVDELVEEMDMMFRWAYFGEEGEGEQWEAAYQLFANELGIPRAGVVYGILVRSRGASIVNWMEDFGGHSEDLIMENVEIHDLVLGMDEIVGLGETTYAFVKNPFNGPVAFEYATDNNLDPLEESVYTGNAFTDVMVALRKLSKNWWYLGRTTMPDAFVTWAESGKQFDEVVTGSIKCNFDTLAHVPKGVVGIRAEYISNTEINNLRIYNLFNVGEMGTDKCGAYTGSSDGGMILQDSKTSPGYGGTQTRAISMFEFKEAKMQQVEISNIMSLNGPAYGLFFINQSQVELTDFKVKHVNSGIGNHLDYSQTIWPNVANEGCAVSWAEKGQVIEPDTNSVQTSCVSGHRFCSACEWSVSDLDSEQLYTCSGQSLDCAESITYKTVVGTFGVDRSGNMIRQEDFANAADVFIDQNNDGYVSVINNPQFIDTSLSAKTQRERYNSMGQSGSSGRSGSSPKGARESANNETGVAVFKWGGVALFCVAVVAVATCLIMIVKGSMMGKDGYKIIGDFRIERDDVTSVGGCDYRGEENELLGTEAVL